MAAAQPVLAIDLGGTQIRAANIAPDLTVSCRRSIPTDDHEGVDAVVERICQLAVAVRDEAARAGLPEPRGAGISSPGPLDPWRGIVISTPNLEGWRNRRSVSSVRPREGGLDRQGISGSRSPLPLSASLSLISR